VGFYLINIGYVALALKERIAPTDVSRSARKRSVVDWRGHARSRRDAFLQHLGVFENAPARNFCKRASADSGRRPKSASQLNDVVFTFYSTLIANFVWALSQLAVQQPAFVAACLHRISIR